MKKMKPARKHPLTLVLIFALMLSLTAGAVNYTEKSKPNVQSNIPGVSVNADNLKSVIDKDGNVIVIDNPENLNITVERVDNVLGIVKKEEAVITEPEDPFTPPDILFTKEWIKSYLGFLDTLNTASEESFPKDMRVNISFVKSYTNGFAFYIDYPKPRVADSFGGVETIGGYFILGNGTPLCFYSYETSSFLLFHPSYETELLGLLSSDELSDLSNLIGSGAFISRVQLQLQSDPLLPPGVLYTKDWKKSYLGFLDTLQPYEEDLPEDTEVSIKFVKSYTNGFAFYLASPNPIPTPATSEMKIGGYTFWVGVPTLCFYSYKTSTFMLVHPYFESELLDLLSSDGLSDLSLTTTGKGGTFERIQLQSDPFTPPDIVFKKAWIKSYLSFIDTALQPFDEDLPEDTEVSIRFVKSYTNGFAFWITYVVPGIPTVQRSEVVDGHTFVGNYYPLCFYSYKTSSFLFFHPFNETKLLELLSSEELSDLSALTKTGKGTPFDNIQLQ